MDLMFEWDARKARANLKKHGVSFEEAKTIFNDPLTLTFPDVDHSNGEQRYLNIGLSSRSRVLVVVHTERNESTRLISCRRATPRERATYEQGDF